MDTVTEARLAIAIAQEGGIGIVHKNLTPQQQAAEVARVKRYESGVLRDPITITPGRHGARGAWRCPSSTASPASRCSTAARWSASSPAATCASRRASTCRCSEIMTPRERLITVPEGTSPAEAKALLHKHKLERVLVVNDAFELQGPDDGEGHHQADQLPERRARRAGQAARRRRGRRGRGHRGARRGAGQGRRRRDRGRHRARPQQGRDRAGALGQAELPAGRRDRRQHRHRRARRWRWSRPAPMR